MAYDFKVGDKVHPKKEYLGKDSECGGEIDEDWGGTIEKVEMIRERVKVSSGYWIHMKEIELDTPRKGAVVKVVHLKYQPGTSVTAFVKNLLKKETDKERIRWLRSFDQCVLPKHVRDTVDEALTVVLRADVFERWGINDHFEKGLANAILIYGPPGTGKTMMCESIAAVLGKNLMKVSSGDLQSNIPGQTERNIVEVFNQAKKNNSVVMFDECDSVLADRNAVGTILAAEINALLTEIERFDGVVVLTTNRLHRLDPALQRRIIAKVELPSPDMEAREQIWKNLLPPKMPVAKDVKVETLAKAELTGGEIKNAILLAARKAIARNEHKVKMAHFEEAVVLVEHAKSDFEGCRPKRVNLSRGATDAEKMLDDIFKEE